MMLIFALVMSVAAFACLAVAMERHQETVFGASLTHAASRILRCAGWCGLLIALWLVVQARGWALGLVHYSGITSIAAGIVYGFLIVCEQRNRKPPTLRRIRD
jgi:hypothetical protein